MDLYSGVFFPRHRVGNRGRETELFIRVSPGHPNLGHRVRDCI